MLGRAAGGFIIVQVDKNVLYTIALVLLFFNQEN
jgi:hypothetical protein